VRTGSRLENGDQFVLRAIEASHTGVALNPHSNVLEFGVRDPPGGKHLADMAPINEKIV